MSYPCNLRGAVVGCTDGLILNSKTHTETFRASAQLHSDVYCANVASESVSIQTFNVPSVSYG